MRLRVLKARRWATFLVLALMGKPLMASDPSYYVVFFAMQGRTWNSPYAGHTFATFIEVREGDGEKATSSFTISWLASDGKVHLFPVAFEGKNFTLQETLNIAMAKDRKLYKWGPYQVRREFYDRAADQQIRLRSGTVKYKVLGRRARFRGTAWSCYQAIADIDTEHGLLIGGLKYGKSATELVVAHLNRWFIDPEITHDWLSEVLGLQNYCFCSSE